jgi:hypothetical protein
LADVARLDTLVTVVDAERWVLWCNQACLSETCRIVHKYRTMSMLCWLHCGGCHVMVVSVSLWDWIRPLSSAEVCYIREEELLYNQRSVLSCYCILLSLTWLYSNSISIKGPGRTAWGAIRDQQFPCLHVLISLHESIQQHLQDCSHKACRSP